MQCFVTNVKFVEKNLKVDKIPIMKSDKSGKKPGGNQPKTHAPKTRAISVMRRRKIIEACLTGKNLKDVAIETGLSLKTANDQVSKILHEPRVQESFVRILEQSGLTDKFLADKIRSLANAETKQFFQLNGKVTDERTQPAWETQRKTIELVAKLRGHLREKTDVDISIGLMQVVVSALHNGGERN